MIFLGPPGTGKTHLATVLGILAHYTGVSVLFDTAYDWVGRPQQAQQKGSVSKELAKISGYGLITIDEVKCLPFEPDAANLFFQLVSGKYEQASATLTSNLPFRRWGEAFGDQTTAATIIYRLVHHAEVHTLTGNSYRTRKRNLDTLPSEKPEDNPQ